MADWWQWSQKREKEALTFAVVGVGRFGTAVCRELIIMVQMFCCRLFGKSY